MKILKSILFGVGLVASLLASPVGAVGVWDACSGNGGSAVCADADKTEATTVVTNIINLLLFGLGIAAVGLIIHSGLKYVTSRGDAANIKSAKDTLLYAVIGLIVASLSFVIVNFVVGAFN